MATDQLMPLLLLLLLLLLLRRASTLSVSVAKETSWVEEGGDLHLRCVLDASPQYIMWSFAPSGTEDPQLLLQCHYSHAECQRKDAFTNWTNTRAFFNGSLLIGGLRRRQDGVYVCDGIKDYDKAKASARAVVVVPGSQPQLQQQPVSPTAGDSLRLNCSSRGGNPPVRLRWYWQAPSSELLGNLTPSANVTHRQPAEKFGESHSVAVLKVGASDDGAVVACRSEQEHSGRELTERLRIRVRHAPIVRAVSDVMAIEKMQTSFSCMASGYPQPRLQLLAPNGSVVQNISDSGLVSLAPLSRQQSGLYSCLATNSLGSNSSRFRLVVQYPPEVRTPTNATVLSGQPLRVPCNVSGRPQPISVEWRQAGTDTAVPGVNGTWLWLPAAARSHAGVWSCNARARLIEASGSSSAYFSSSTVQVRVQYQPSAPSAEQPAEAVSSGSSASVRCRPNERWPGEPAPTLRWTRRSDGREVGDADGWLRVDSATLSDAGEYHCRAVNSVGASQPAIVSLEVVQPPQFVEAQEAAAAVVAARSGDTEFSLRCRLRANPRPAVRWLTQYRLPVSDTRFIAQLLLTRPELHEYDSLLHFRGESRSAVQLNDTGNFTCVADNELGSRSRTFRLEVQSAPRIVNPVAQVALVSGDRLACLFISHSGFRVSWDSADSSSSSSSMVGTATPVNDSLPLLHRSAGPEGVGNFSCTVTNSLGSASRLFRVVHESLPEPPAQLAAASVSWDSFLLTWPPAFDGGHPCELRLSVSGWNSTAGRLVTQQLRPSLRARRQLVRRLFPDTAYSVEAVPASSLGVGSPAPVLKVTTSHLRLPAVAEPRWLPAKGTFEFRGAEGHCARVEASDDSGVSWRPVAAACVQFDPRGHRLSLRNAASVYRVSLCLAHRPHICGPPYTTYSISKLAGISMETIVIVASVCTLVVSLLAAVLLCLCVRRRCSQSRTARRREEKRRSGHANSAGSSQLHSNKTAVAYVSPAATENLSNQTQDSHETCLDGSSFSATNGPPSPLLLASPHFTAAHAFPSSFCESDGTDSRDSPPTPAKHRKVIYEVVV